MSINYFESLFGTLALPDALNGIFGNVIKKVKLLTHSI